MEQLLNLILVGDMRAIGNGIGIPFRRNTGQGVIWPPDLKSALVCWYSPRKQKLTEYDVIEAYAEDFTKWAYRNSRGTAKITNNAIVITNVVETNNIVEDAKEPYSDLTIRVTGVTEDKYLIVRQGRGKPEAHIKKDGIYTFKDNNLYFGFGVSVIGGCNITITQLPTSILKDLSGNGLDAYMYGFKGKLNSGVGVYKEDFTTWNYVPERGDVTRSYNTIHITKVTNTVTANIISKTEEFGNSITLKIVGATADNPLMIGTYSKPNGYTAISKDGVYSFEIDAVYWGFRFNKDGDVNVTITQIPNYPNQLCYSGKEYCISYNQPILTDYTVIADRTWFENAGNRVFITKGNIWPNCAFTFEKVNVALNSETFSYSQSTNIDDLIGKSGITYQTKQSYNGKVIGVGTSSDGDILLIGGQLKGEYIGCHSDFLLFNRTLTQEEIDWVKNNCFVIDIPTPTYDFDFSKLKSGQDTFVDKYGNELSLYNFQWAGMSGKDGYYTDFNSWQFYPSLSTVEHSSEKLIIKKVNSTAQFCASDFVGKFTAEVSGIPEGVKFYYRYIDKTTGNAVSTTLSNGINEVDCSNANGDANMTNMFLIGADNKDINIVIRQIPVYPNALVFDGVDDYALLPSEASKLIKSVILDVVPLKENSMLYDQRTPDSSNTFAIYNAEDKIAYNARNNGNTYIDGVLNTTFVPSQLTDRHMQVVITNNNVSKVNNPIFVGAARGGTTFHASMALYRITGFTEVLTPDQVWKWYQKNQPKGGDK